MGKFVYFDQTGGPEVFKIGQRNEAEPQANEVLIRQTAIGVNFIDVQTRRGNYPSLSSPTICGIEACGIIEKLGSEVQGFKVGQRVAYATIREGGAYAEYRCIDAKYIVNAPEALEDNLIAASLAKGLTAHYLARRVFLVSPGMAVLVHSAAGGVGQMLSSLCKSLGALVIGTIGSEDKREAALKTCHYIVNHKNEGWGEEIKHFTQNLGVNAVYDAIGKDTFYQSLECLMPAGIMIYYGHASGFTDKLDLSLLSKKSLFLTCPVLFDYKANRMELVLSADEVFSMITKNIMSVNITTQFPLSQAAEAHKLLESGLTTGSIVLIP